MFGANALFITLRSIGQSQPIQQDLFQSIFYQHVADRSKEKILQRDIKRSFF